VHRVLSACGIRDASASIYGSTHKINVVKAVIQLLHGGVSHSGLIIP
jgi:small subunit ribosomal protein S5